MKQYPKTKPEHREKHPDPKIPWWFRLQIKDLLEPIVLRRYQLFLSGIAVAVLGLLGYLVWDNYLREPTAEELLNEMVDAAGGMEAWKQIRDGQFTRTHRLYADDGSLLRTTEETFYFQKSREGLKLQIRSAGDDNSVVWVGKDQEGYWATRDNSIADPKTTAKEEGMMCDSEFCEPLCASSMAFYRFSMPFKLKDKGIQASLASTDLSVANLGMLQLKQGNPTLVDIAYEPDIGRDRWRFYVDPADQLIRKVEYYNKSDIGEARPEEIYWSDHRTVEGITFSHRWTRYWPNGKVMDEYLYSDVEFNTDIAESFFHRPDASDIALTQ